VTRWPLRLIGVSVALSAGALGACGGPGLTPDASRELITDVADVRAATASGDRAVADVALAELRASVERLQASEAIEDDKATEILAAASDVEAALALMPTTTTTTTTLPPEDDDDDDDAPGKGRGKDPKKDDDD